MKTRWCCLTAILLCACSAVADEAEDLSAIQARTASYLAAFNRQDAEAVAEHWSVSAVFVQQDTGERVQGRDKIRAAFAEAFAGDDSLRLIINVERVRMVSEGVAVEDGTTQVVSSSSPATESAYTAIHVKRDGAWYIDSVRERDKAPTTLIESPLEQLAWMIGEWEDQEQDARIYTRCSWTKNKSFIVKSFQATIEDQIELEGTQIIGWDAAAETIRSWTFDSDGGFAKATWRRKENSWEVHRSAVLSDGRKASSVNVISLVDENTYRWRSFDRRVGGEILPAIEDVAVTRVTVVGDSK